MSKIDKATETEKIVGYMSKGRKNGESLLDG